MSTYLVFASFLTSVVLAQPSTTDDTYPILVFILSRHGDRTPMHELPEDPYKSLWTGGRGQLTQDGVEQLISFGRFIRKSYPNLISTTYIPVYETFFRSSGTDRTLRSAESFIRGLYGLEPTMKGFPPVYSIPVESDHLLKMSSNCTSFTTLFRDFMDSQEVARSAEQFSDTLSLFEKHFPILFPEDSTLTARLRVGWKICDPVGIWTLRELPQPYWLTSEIAQQCAKMLDFKHYIRFSTPTLTRLRGGPLVAHLFRLLRIRANFEASHPLSSEPKTKSVDPLPLVAPISGLDVVHPRQRLIAYFAHDSTLAAVMSHLGIFNGLKPPFASSLIVELHYKPTSTEDFFVRFRYRNQTKPTDTVVYSLWPPACGPVNTALEYDFMCPLSQLESAVVDTYVVHIDAECSAGDEAAIVKQLELATNTYYPWIVALFFAQLFLCIYFMKRVRPRSSER